MLLRYNPYPYGIEKQYNPRMECRVGIVESIIEGKLQVRITRHSACSNCHARGACTSQDVQEQLITISDYPAGIKPGDAVSIIADSGLSMKAVLYAFVIPLILLIGGALLLSARGISEDVMVVVLLVVLALYGGVLWLLRGYFTRVFSFRAEPKFP